MTWPTVETITMSIWLLILLAIPAFFLNKYLINLKPVIKKFEDDLSLAVTSGDEIIECEIVVSTYYGPIDFYMRTKSGTLHGYLSVGWVINALKKKVLDTFPSAKFTRSYSEV